MGDPTDKPTADQRKALEQCERRADRERPQNFKDDENRDKVVEVLPVDGDSTPIKGLDPAR